MHEQIAANKRKTVLLFVVAIAFTALIGYAIGFLFFRGGVAGVVIATVLAVALSLGSYFAGDRIVLASTGAREVTAEQEPRLHNIVEGSRSPRGSPSRASMWCPSRRRTRSRRAGTRSILRSR